MSDAVLVVLTTSVASIVSIVFSQLIAGWISRRKTEVDIGKVKSETNLSEGDLVLKYQKIAMDQADENTGLSNRNKQQEAEKTELLTALQELRNDMQKMDQSHKEEIAKLNQSFETERQENLLWKFWAKRLVLQLRSYDILPVPFDLSEIKSKDILNDESDSLKTLINIKEK
jgi:hypothetical protein